MAKKALLMGMIFFFIASIIPAQDAKPLPADQIMKEAYAKAKAGDKNVFLIFHATWCSWCKRLDKAMQSDELKRIFEKNFEITHLDVMERGEKIAQFENAGGKELMDKLGGAKSGIPFYAFLTPEGEMLANSNVMPKDQNIGYPGVMEEIDAFMKIVTTGAPKMTEAEKKTIISYLKKNAPKPIE